MLKKGLKSFVLISAIVGFVFVGMAFSGKSFTYAGDEKTIECNISGMTCGACSKKVKTALEHCPGVIEADVNHKTGKATVKVEEGKVDKEVLIDAVKKAGFTVES